MENCTFFDKVAIIKIAKMIVPSGHTGFVKYQSLMNEFYNPPGVYILFYCKLQSKIFTITRHRNLLGRHVSRSELAEEANGTWTFVIQLLLCCQLHDACARYIGIHISSNIALWMYNISQQTIILILQIN